MYHRILNIYIASKDSHLETLLRGIPPVENFSHRFSCHPEVHISDLKKYDIIILDGETVKPDTLEEIHSAIDDTAKLIGCFSADSFQALAAYYHLFDRIWIKPLVKEKVLSSFSGILGILKSREDSALNRQYLDTLIDSLPDLIWFKDARGAHLKVNKSFCQAVNKTKEQIEGRGHYYVWDLEPDEYAKGEYVCLESEEVVLNKKETCLFDETVKCGNELRKFKTYKSPIVGTDGKVIGTVGFAHDVTDLQNLMIELNILVESLPFAVMVTNRDRTITIVNQKFIDYLELDRTKVVGKPVDCLLDETQTFTQNKKWIIEKDEAHTLLLSKDKVINIQEEELLDVFGVIAGYIHLFMDVTLEHQYKNKLLIDANTDYLTKLNNRRSLQDFMRKTPCQRDTALLLTDLDNFKEVNDQYGHDEGDRVLIAFANLLKEMFPVENLFRLGGDEFAIILHNMKTPDVPKQYAEQLLEKFNSALTAQFTHTGISISIGISMNINDSNDFGELFKRADMALYESKESGKNKSTFWKR